MYYDSEKDYAKTKIAEYLTSNFSVKLTKKNFRCVNPTHEDKKPSMSYDSRRYKVHCFSASCNADYDIFDLYAIKNNLTPNSKEVFDGVYNWLGISTDKPKNNNSFLQEKNTITSLPNEVRDKGTDYRQFFIEAQKNLSDRSCVEYLGKRGISQEIAKKYGLGYVKDWQSPKALKENKNPPKTRRVIIPTSDFSYAARDISEKENNYSKMKEGEINIFNLEVLKEELPCFVTEGEFDALSFLELGYNAVSLGSASNTRSFLRKIKELSNNCSLIIVLDSDDGGIKAVSALQEGLSEISNLNPNINFFIPDKFCGTYKDANEFLVKDKVGFENAIEKALSSLEDLISTEVQAKLEETEIEKSDYFDESVSNKISDLRDYINASKNDKILSTGFNNLDNILGGGLYEGLYIIGAISSLGKTTFAIQIADYLSSQGHDVLYISLEMSRYEIMAKSISRHTFLLCENKYPKPQYGPVSQIGIMQGRLYDGYSPDQKEIIYNAGENYKEESKRLWIYEVSDDLIIDNRSNTDSKKRPDIESLIKNHQKYTNNYPVVIIDYLQIITPTSDKLTEKQSTDQIVKRLKQISRDFKIPILAISSLNRESYKSPISMQSFKESGGIEYSADVLLGLQLKNVENKDDGKTNSNFNAEVEKNKDPREVELKVLKNRRGQTGKKIDFYYYPKYNYFTDRKIY
jgi:replicative DNA helicase